MAVEVWRLDCQASGQQCSPHCSSTQKPPVALLEPLSPATSASGQITSLASADAPTRVLPVNRRADVQ
eukprot:1383964-Heterocapsa_arctica.AAC.1